jgi:anti-sigma-K factor RskA
VSDHDQFRELIEGYALGSLDQPERAALEAHLAAGCPECAQALQEARWLVTQLVYLAPEAQPSDMLRGRLLQRVRAEGSAAGTGGSPVTAPSLPRAAVPFWMWAGLAALLLVTVYSTWTAQRLRNEIAILNAQIADQLKEREQRQRELTIARHEAHILIDPESKKFVIWPNDKQMPKLEAAWHPAMGIYVTGQKIPMPSSNHVLQLWLIPKDPKSKPMPSHTFSPDAQGAVALMVDDPPEVLAETKALAVTEEPMGGSLQPTSTPMWVGGVS